MALRKQNGFTEPREGTLTRKVWDAATRISEEHNRPAMMDEVIKACGNSPKLSTIQTQYSRWKSFHGLEGKLIVPAEVTPIPEKQPAKAPSQPIKEIDQAFDNGFDAYIANKNLSDNPYLANSPEFKEWEMGFQTAEQTS